MGIGWSFSLYKKASQETTPARTPVSYGSRIAEWPGAISGRRWLDTLVGCNAAIFVEGNDYPSVYTLQAANVVEHVPSVAQEIAASCTPEEWVVLEVWDLS